MEIKFQRIKVKENVNLKSKLSESERERAATEEKLRSLKGSHSGLQDSLQSLEREREKLHADRERWRETEK
jgi:hypothetical protein